MVSDFERRDLIFVAHVHIAVLPVDVSERENPPNDIRGSKQQGGAEFEYASTAGTPKRPYDLDDHSHVFPLSHTRRHSSLVGSVLTRSPGRRTDETDLVSPRPEQLSRDLKRGSKPPGLFHIHEEISGSVPRNSRQQTQRILGETHEHSRTDFTRSLCQKKQ